MRTEFSVEGLVEASRTLPSLYHAFELDEGFDHVLGVFDQGLGAG